MSRVTKTQPHKQDFTAPIDPAQFKVVDGDCLGKEWDMRSKECPVCAMCDICSILFQSQVRKKIQQVEAQHATFLDKTDFAAIDQQQLRARIEAANGQMNVGDLVEEVHATAQTDDEVAVVEWIKRFLRDNGLKTTEGKIWKR